MPKQIDEDLLIQAAAEVFAERGYAGAGVAEIARRAGVTTGAIYSRYSGKSVLRSLDYKMPEPEEWQKVLNQTQRSILKSVG